MSLSSEAKAGPIPIRQWPVAQSPLGSEGLSRVGSLFPCRLPHDLSCDKARLFPPEVVWLGWPRQGGGFILRLSFTMFAKQVFN